MPCEDYPCCGHDICPDFDDDGRQLNMRCVCGAVVPLDSPSSLCPSCLRRGDPEDPESTWDEEDDWEDEVPREVDYGADDDWLDREYEDQYDIPDCDGF